MSLDWQIYRQLYRQTDDPMWGMFPHPSIGDIAKDLGITRGTVWRRLAELRRIGFLEGYEVIPNPALLGVGLSLYGITIPDPRDRLRFLDELEFVDGIFLATIDFGERANVIAISDLPSSRSRREKMLQRIEGVKSLSRATPVGIPGCDYEVPKEGWQFIHALRNNPTWSLERIAKHLGISSKTASTRYRLLKRERAILGHPIENFTKFPGTVIGILLTLKHNADLRTVARAVERLQPEILDVPAPARRPGGGSSMLGFMWLVRNASETDQVTVALLDVPGVAEATTFFPGTLRAYRHWFDARIYEILGRRLLQPGSRERPVRRALDRSVRTTGVP